LPSASISSVRREVLGVELANHETRSSWRDFWLSRARSLFYEMFASSSASAERRQGMRKAKTLTVEALAELGAERLSALLLEAACAQRVGSLAEWPAFFVCECVSLL
jgi:hypothetical protein